MCNHQQGSWWLSPHFWLFFSLRQMWQDKIWGTHSISGSFQTLEYYIWGHTKCQTKGFRWQLNACTNRSRPPLLVCRIQHTSKSVKVPAARKEYRNCTFFPIFSPKISQDLPLLLDTHTQVSGIWGLKGGTIQPLLINIANPNRRGAHLPTGSKIKNRTNMMCKQEGPISSLGQIKRTKMMLKQRVPISPLGQIKKFFFIYIKCKLYSPPPA